MSKSKWERIGSIDVDAGLCWIGDPCYVFHRDEGDEPENLGKNWHEFCDNVWRNGEDKMFTQFNHNMGHAGLGVAVSTGYGDGTYPVEARIEDCGDWGKRIAEIRILFINEPEEQLDEIE